MQPICVLLPVGHDAARDLWTVLELGYQTRASAHARWLRPAPAPRSDDAPDHLRILAALVREHLIGPPGLNRVIWLERRELVEVLRLVECGLSRLEQRGNLHLSSTILESVASFLCGLHTQLGSVRKPAQRHHAPRVRVAAAGGV